MEKEKKKCPTKKGKEVGRRAPSPEDPMGSYTGVPRNPYETPVQDADDL